MPTALRKTFVVDTNVLLHSPNAIFAFADNHLVIPITVLEELDRFKSANNELGQNAREVARGLDRLRALGSLRDGVATPQGGRVTVAMRFQETTSLLPGVADNRIIGCALLLKNEGGSVIFVSKDINARIKADALGIPSEDFKNQKVDADGLYTGYRTIALPAARYAEATAHERIDPELVLPAGADEEEAQPLSHNQFVHLTDAGDPRRETLAMFDAPAGRLRRLAPACPALFGVGPRSIEQRMAFELLLDDEVKLVTLVGRAGTGKTLLALACGLSRTIQDERYNKLLVSRPIMPLGQDIGYLPGTKDEKMAHWMGPIFDNLHFLLAQEERDPDEVIKRLVAEETIVLEALTYIRGRSISKQFAIVDESQNLTPHEIKTIISRCGTDTKIVLTGDPHQIDNPYLDSSSNGLTYVVERMRGQRVAGHVTLTKSERSELAGIAAAIL
jgi:PhoH-like ATPase